MYFINQTLKQTMMKKRSRQVGSLYSSMVLGLFISIGVSIVNTRFLGPQQYGDLKFLQNLFTLVAGILTFGMFVTGSTLLAQKTNETVKYEITGNLIVLGTFISIVLIAVFFIFSFFEESIFSNDLGRTMRVFSPLLFVIPFQLCLEKILTGDNQIYALSLLRIVPSTFYLLGAITFNYFISLSLTSALAIQFFSASVVIFIIVIYLKPKFENIKKNISYIWKQNRAYGFHVYIGYLAAVGSGKLAGVWIGYEIDNTNVGFYSLALTLTMPLMMIPNAVSSVFFKDYANSNSIPRKVTAFTIALTISTLIVFVLIIDKVVFFVYSVEYSPVIPLAYYVSIGSAAYGFGDYYNKFLGAHGQGKVMRNGSIIVGLINILGYILLLKYLGIAGAAITNVISSFVYLCVRYYPYYKLINNNTFVNNQIKCTGGKFL